jgi:hypothetical protein
MPWRVTSPMYERQRFVLDAQSAACAFAELCRRYAISRKTGYKTRPWSSVGPPRSMPPPTDSTCRGSARSRIRSTSRSGASRPMGGFAGIGAGSTCRTSSLRCRWASSRSPAGPGTSSSARSTSAGWMSETIGSTTTAAASPGAANCHPSGEYACHLSVETFTGSFTRCRA